MKNLRLAVIALAISSLGSLGCGIDDAVTGAVVAGSCTLTGGVTNCIDYTGSGYTGVMAQDHCSQQSNSTYSTSRCTATGRVASCTVLPGQVTEVTWRYYAPFTTAPESAPAACTILNGSYTAG